jgi:hypothetical protein
MYIYGLMGEPSWMFSINERFGKYCSCHLQAAISLFSFTNHHSQMQIAAYGLPYMRLPKSFNYYIFALKIETTICRNCG